MDCLFSPLKGCLTATTSKWRYYNFRIGPAEFFALDTNSICVEDLTKDGEEAQWLKKKLAASTAPHRIVVQHQLPYSNVYFAGDTVDRALAKLRWPFKEWGATHVLSGHSHTFERFKAKDGMNYVVCGVSGTVPFYPKMSPQNHTQFPGMTKVWYNKTHGFIQASIDKKKANFTFVTIDGSFTYFWSSNPYEKSSSKPLPAPPPAASAFDSTELLVIGICVGMAIGIIATFIIQYCLKYLGYCGGARRGAISSSSESGGGGEESEYVRHEVMNAEAS